MNPKQREGLTTALQESHRGDRHKVTLNVHSPMQMTLPVQRMQDPRDEEMKRHVMEMNERELFSTFQQRGGSSLLGRG
jgi:hypothetical protein